MELSEYKAIREAGIELGEEIFKLSTSVFKYDIIIAAKLLGMWDGKMMVFKDENDTDALMDFMVFEKPAGRATACQRFYDSKPELTELQQENLNGMLHFHSSLFEVKHIDSANYTMLFVDVLDQNKKEYLLMDVGLSRTAMVSLLIYMRLIPIRGEYITSGLGFVFDHELKEKLLSTISLTSFKKRRKLTSTELFLLFYEKNRQYGLSTRTE